MPWGRAAGAGADNTSAGGTGGQDGNGTGGSGGGPTAGAGWTQRGTSHFWVSVASSADGTKLVATTMTDRYGADGYIYASADSGVTWTQTGTQLQCDSVASSSDGTKLVAVECGGYVYTFSSLASVIYVDCTGPSTIANGSRRFGTSRGLVRPAGAPTGADARA